MKLKIYIVLIFIFAAGIGLAQEPLCIDWLPVYICPFDTFEIDVCYDTLNPGFVYDSIYIYSNLEFLNLGSSGHWYVLEPAPADTPIIWNNTYFDGLVTGDWIFGWDSVYIAADSGGTIVADSAFWIFNYPPDSMWTDTTINICPYDSSWMAGKWLNVSGAYFWNWQTETLFVYNDFVHRDIIDSLVCITPDHHSYTAPDSLDPWAVDTLYDPCPTPLCTTFTLLPTDVIDDTLITLCRAVAETVIIPTYYPYDHDWILDGFVIYSRSGIVAADTFMITAASCGTSWVYYDITGGCDSVRLDSFAIYVPCQSYDIIVNSSFPHDSGSPYCYGETLTFCLTGDSLESNDICWDLPGADACSTCIQYITDTSFTAYVTFTDRFGCEYFDSISIVVNPEIIFTLTDSGGCTGEQRTLTVIPAPIASIDYVVFQFGDGSWDFIYSPDTAGNFVTHHTYDGTGIYLVYATVYDSIGCFRMDSIWLRQSEVYAELTVDENPACLLDEILLDASASFVEPAGVLVYRFFDNAGDSIYFGELPYCTDTVESAGVWSLWVVDTAAGCSSYTFVALDVKWVEIFAPDTVYTIEGCVKCEDILALPHNCDEEVIFGYAEYDTNLAAYGDMLLLPDEEFCTPPILSELTYMLYAWCAECPDAPDSTEMTAIPVMITGITHDTILCFGQFMPGLLDSSTVTPTGLEDSILCQVVFINTEETIEDTIWDWAPLSILPADFSGYPAIANGMLEYRFALNGEMDCYNTISARVTLHHPVAVLDILPGEYICEGHLDTLDASDSYSNCTGATLCYRYFELLSDVLVPLDAFTDSMCCASACSIYAIPDAPEVGVHTYAVVVCMEEVLWCCDTAYATLGVCDIETPVVSISGECAADTIAADAEIQLTILNADMFTHFCWDVTETTLVPCFSDSSILVYTPTIGESLVVELFAFRCEFACTSYDSMTFYINQPPICDTINLTIIEDVCPYTFMLADSVTDLDGDSLIFSLISGPTGLTVDSAGSLVWDCPGNCEVGISRAEIEITEISSCASVCTSTIILTVENTFTGITGYDTLWGFSCIETPLFSGDTLWIINLQDCYDISMQLYADDLEECDCGFWSAEMLYWLNVNEYSGIISADLYTVPRDTYPDIVYYSDCSDTDSVVVMVSVANHPPRASTVPYELWVPSGQETVAVRSLDFSDIDGDVVNIDNATLTNSANYIFSTGETAVTLQPDINYRNFPGSPDTLEVTASDGHGGSITTTILVWVYNPSDVRPENRKPYSTTLIGAYPNPFNSSVWIEMELVNSGHISLAAFDNSGRVAHILFDGVMPSGVFRFIWNGDDSNGADMPSGTYWIMLSVNDEKFSLPVQLIR